MTRHGHVATSFGRRKMIRKARAADIPSLVALQTSSEEENCVLGYRADSADEWVKRDLAWTLIAFHGANPVGFVYCRPRPYSGECVFPDDSRILEIVDLIIAKPCRGRGLGHRLVEAIQRKARREGFTHLRLYSGARRFDDVVRFYRSCGFTPWYLEMTQDIRAESAGPGDP